MDLKLIKLLSMSSLLVWASSCQEATDQTAEEAEEVYATEHAIAHSVPVIADYNNQIFDGLTNGGLTVYYTPDFSDPIPEEEIEGLLTYETIVAAYPEEGEDDAENAIDSVIEVKLTPADIVSYALVEALHFNEEGDLIDSEIVGIAPNYIPQNGEEAGAETSIAFISLSELEEYLGEEEFTTFSESLTGTPAENVHDAEAEEVPAEEPAEEIES